MTAFLTTHMYDFVGLKSRFISVSVHILFLTYPRIHPSKLCGIALDENTAVSNVSSHNGETDGVRFKKKEKEKN